MNLSNKEKFKIRIRELRSNTRLNGEQFGKLFGVTSSSVNRWENGLCFPNEDQQIAIADYFDVSLDYLMGRTDVKKPASDNFQFAFSDYDKLTDDQKEIIKNLAASLIAQNEKK